MAVAAHRLATSDNIAASASASSSKRASTAVCDSPISLASTPSLTTPKNSGVGMTSLNTPLGPTPGSSMNTDPRDSIRSADTAARSAVAMSGASIVSEDEAEEPEHIIRIRALLQKLLSSRGSSVQRQVTMKEEDIKTILTSVREAFMAEPMLVHVEPPVRICGDIHGQFYDLLRIFDRCGLPPDTNYVFLGDYVDRGKHSLETIVLMYAFKVLYPRNVTLLRGNHECASINKMYGFYDDVKRRYNVRLFKQFADVFNCMPVVCSVGNKILCMHGGLSPELDDLEKINTLKRPLDVPEAGLLCDLLWADPEAELEGFVDSDRGVSYLFGEDVVTDFLDLHGYDLIVRAHQVVEKGYQFFSERQLVTLFSAPNYCGEFDNHAAVMSVDSMMRCSFAVIQ